MHRGRVIDPRTYVEIIVPVEEFVPDHILQIFTITSMMV